MRPKPFATLAAGLILLGLLLLLPRAQSSMSSLFGRGRASAPAAAVVDPAASSARAVDPAAVENPNWPPKQPPPRSARSKPQTTPLDKLARGITAMPAGSEAAFVMRDKRTSAFFTDSGVVMCAVDLPKPHAGSGEKTAYAVRWGLAGAAASAPRAEGERPDKINHFMGGDSSKWLSEQSTYSTIAYDSVQPGIDLEIESRPSALKYTVHVAAGADLSALRFRVEGAHNVSVNEDGAAVEITTGVGPIVEDGLVCTQDGPDGRRKVEARYERVSSSEYAIVVGEHDPDLPLVIDPVIKWSTYLGGSQSPQGEDDGYGIAVDGAGNTYITGYTYCVDMPATVGGLTLKGTVDGFLTKLNNLGNFVWFGYIGGTGADFCNAVAVDPAGTGVYVTGYTGSADFPTTVNAFSRALSGSYDTFVMRVEPTGLFGTTGWSTFLGGFSLDYGQGIAVDAGGNVLVTGYTYSSNFPIVNAFRGSMTSGPDGFITKLNPTGTGLLWSSFLGGNNSDYAYGVAVDQATGNVYVTGYTYSSDFPNTVFPGGPLKGTVDAFLMKVNGSTGSLAWSTLIGGTNSDYGQGVCVTTDGDPVVVGYTYSTDLPTTLLAAKPAFLGGTIDTFVTRYSAAGTGVVYCTYLGGNSLDYGQAIAPGNSGSVYVTGYTYSSNFPNLGGYRPTLVGGGDGFVTQVAGDGKSILATTYFGGTSWENFRGIATVLSGANAGVYLTGTTQSADYPHPGGADQTLGGQYDAFGTKLNLALNTLGWSTFFGGNFSLGDDYGYGVAVDPSAPDTVYVAGQTISSNFPTVGPIDPSLGGLQDAFITKINLNGGGIPQIVWSTYWGGSSYEYVTGLAVDSGGFAYVTGYTYSSDFVTASQPNPAPPVIGPTYRGGVDGFVTQFFPTGSLYYSTFLGGTTSDYAYAIAVDDQFNAVITGYTYSADFPVSAGSAKTTISSTPDAFVLKLGLTGNGIFGTFLGGNNTDYGYGVAITASGAAQRVYVTGQTYSSDFVPGGVTSADNALSGTVDAFATCLNGNTGAYVWSRYLGGTSSDYGQCVAVDPSGTGVYFSGYTFSSDFPTTPGVFRPLMTGAPDVFVTRIDPANGNHNTGAAWSSFLGGFSSDYAYAMAVDTSQNVYVTGYTYSSDFPNKGAVQPLINVTPDAFATKIYANGSAIAWSTFLGGSKDDLGYAIAVNSATGSVYVAGITNSPDFPFASGFDNTLGGQVDAFIVRLDNANPDAPDFSAPGTGQFKLNGTTQLGVGAWTNEDNFIVKAKVSDSDDDQVKLQIELRLISVDFNGTVTDQSPSFVAPGGITSLQVALPGVPVARCHWRARTIDTTGRVSPWVSFGGNTDLPLPATRDIGKDKTGPGVAISSPTPPTFYTTSSSIGMNGTTSDADSGVTSISYFNAANSASGGAFLSWNPVTGTGTWSIAAIPLVASNPVATTNVITISAMDAAGNTTQTNITVYRDAVLPDGSIAGADFDTSSNGATLNVTATDNVVVSTVTWSNDRGGSGFAVFDVGTGKWIANITGLSPGANVITITVTDGAGNIRQIIRNIYYDDQPPLLAITTSAAPYTNVRSWDLAGTASDNRGLAAVNPIHWRNLDEGSQGDTTVTGGNWSVTGIPLKPNVNNVIEVSATDAVGLQTFAYYSVREDEVAPTLSVSFPVTPPQFITGTNNIDVQGTALDDVGVKAITWSRTPAVLPAPPNFNGQLDFVGDAFSPWTISAVPLASNTTSTITVTLTDLAGNTATYDVDVYYDTNAPTITISSPTTNPKVTNSNTINISGNASDSNGTVQYISVANLTTGAPAFVTGNAPPLDVNAPNLGTNNVDWDVTGLVLQAGSNTIQIVAKDNTPLTTVTTLTVIYDPNPPNLNITGPTTADDYYTGINSLLVSGVAFDNRAVTQVTWSVGALPPPAAQTASGTCLGTTSWNVNPASPIPLVLGTQTVTITAFDEALNTFSQTLVVTYDPALPDIVINSPTVADTMVTTNASVVLGGTASDNIQLQSVTWINAATGSSGSISGSLAAWTTPSIVLAAGANPITVIATDRAGNLRTDSIVVSRDIALPTVAIVTPVPTGGTYTTSANNVTLSGIAGDDIGLLSITWSNGANGTSGSATGLAAWTTTAITLKPGNNVITITAKDLRPSAPNTTIAQITVHYDDTDPLIQITGPVATPTTSTTDSPILLSGTASDLDGAGALLEVTHVGWANLTTGGSGTAALTPGSWSAPVPLTPGANSIQVTATDAAGRTASDTITVTYDPAAPIVTIITPTSGLTFATGTAPAVLAGIASDDVGIASITWSSDAAVFPSSGAASGPPDWSTWTALPPLAPGINTITVTATDTVGRTGTARLTITYDPTAPSVAITYPTSDSNFQSTITPMSLGGAASDNLQIQSVTWVNTTTGENGLASGVGAWTIPTLNLIEGPNVITVTATDGVGNQAQATVTINYDGTPPTIGIDATPATTSTRPLLITGTAGDNLSLTSVTWTNSLGGGGAATLTPVTATTFTWSASIYLYPDPVLDNVITFTATDAHGYQTTAQVAVKFTPESLAPSVAITGPSGTGSAVSPTQIVATAGTADDNVGVVAVTWKNTTTGVKGSAIVVPRAMSTVVDWTADIPLANGSNVIVVTAVDDAGNLTTATITIDYAAPSDAVIPAINHTAPVLPNVGVYDTSTAPVLVSLTATDNVGITSVTWVNSATGGAGVATFVSGSAWTAAIGLAVGANNLTFTAYDPAGNSAQDVLLVNFTAPPGDLIPPGINITSHSTVTPTTVTVSTLDIAGTASDNIQLAEIVWFDAATNVSGDAEGLGAWTGQLQLVAGVNVITLRAFDTSGNSTTSQMTVVYNPPPPPPPAPVHIQAGACGLTGLEAVLALALAAGLRRRSRKGRGR